MAITMEFKKTTFSKIKRGEYFRFPGKKTVYEFLGGGPARGYMYVRADDISAYRTTKVNREIEIGFDY